ncbi:MAG: peptidoglycan recognition protein [Thermoleophilaceae bacterium]|nr:peptidoglycan recognition protein [Thermoleophilaceae bacterium]
MARVLLTLVAILAACLAVVAAPAVSLQPYRPKAVEFELAPAPGAAHRSAGGAVISAPLRAPRRFNLVGLSWRGRSHPQVSLRVRRDGGGWSRWASVGDGPDSGPDRGRERGGTTSTAPAWAGQADWVQYRLSRPAAGVRLHFLNTTGTATVADRARTAIRRAVSAAVLALVGPPSAHAQASEPEIMPRSAWGADQCPPRAKPDYGEVKVAFVHHTVTIDDYTSGDVPAMILGICRYHRNANGWNDIGYNFLVDKFGRIWEGRAGGVDEPVVGAQAQGYNAQSTGIANLGTYDSTPVTDAALDAMARLIRWKLPLSGAPTTGTVQLTSAGGASNRFPSGTKITVQRVSGHRDVDSTECPGSALYSQLAVLRDRVGSVEPRTPRTRIGVSLSPSVLTYGAATRLSGTLRTLKGPALPGAPVNVQMFSGGAWKTIASTTTRSDGSWSLQLEPSAKRILRAQFPGRPGYLASSSRQVVVQVRPEISLERSVARASVGRTPTIAGRIRPAKRTLTIVVERRVGRTARRVAALRVAVRNGRFRKSFRLPAPGLYRYRAVFAGDRAHLAASSAGVYVRAVASRGR